MLKQVYKIDENGYLQEISLRDFTEDDNFVNDEINNIIVIDPPNGLYRARWVNGGWIEDMSQEEIDALNKQPSAPTLEERLQSAEDTILFLLGGM